jgi:hypothetical protein
MDLEQNNLFLKDPNGPCPDESLSQSPDFFMAKWSDIIKKKDIDFRESQKSFFKCGPDGLTKSYRSDQRANDSEIKIIKQKKNNSIQKRILNYNLKNPDDEFEFIFNKFMVNIKVDFENYINNQAFPFMDNNLNLRGYNFYDFLKYNSKNYSDISNKIEEENYEHIIDIEKEDDDDIIYYEEYE